MSDTSNNQLASRDDSDRHTVVIFSANSSDVPLDLELEARRIEEARLLAKYRDDFEVTVSPAARTADLVRKVRRSKPKVVHFAGHGSFEGIRLRANDPNGFDVVSGYQLETFFRERDVELVVLNSCFSDEQAEAIARVVPAVIGTSAAVLDSVAVAFVKLFYQTLFDGFTIEEALRDSQDNLGMLDLNSPFRSRGELGFGLTDVLDDVPSVGDGFLGHDGVDEAVRQLGTLGKAGQIVDRLLLYRTARQRTWLVATTEALYVLLDDQERRSKDLVVRARLPLEAAGAASARRGHGNTGYIDLGTPKAWRYSSRLYGTPEELERRVRRLALPDAA